jgi:sugar transferase (PEP-CTERM/EpsH1 system associated)
VTGETQPLVLHVIHHLVTGGMENGLVNLITRLPVTEFRHAVACIENYSEFRQRLAHRDVEVIALNRSRVGIWRVRRSIYDVCRRLRPMLVHTRNLSGLDALLPARLAGVALCVHSEHGWDVNDLRGDRWRPALLRRLHSPLVDHYITVSRDLEQYLVRRVGIAPNRISHVCNGVDVERFSPAVEKPVHLLPVPLRVESPFIIGSVGRMQPVKDQAVLVRAFAELIQVNPGLRTTLRLAIVGDGPLLLTLRELAHSLGVADLTWFPGAVSNVPELLRLFDLFVLPSLNEGISNTILEAMASGLPVVATRVGGNVEIIEEGGWGQFFEPGNVSELARLLVKYVGDPAMRTAHAAASRRAALDSFSIDTMVAQYRAIYHTLLRDDRLCRA